MKNIFILLLSIIAISTVFGAVYKWVDDKGKIHYTDELPPDQKSKEIAIEPGPDPEKAKEALDRLDNLRKQRQQSREIQKTNPDKLKRLGKFPDNKTSKYLKTFDTGISYHFDDRTANLSITVQVKNTVPHSVLYLEAHFQIPSNPESPIIVGKTWRAPQSVVVFVTPYLKGIQCSNYKVFVNVCRETGCEKGDHDTEPSLYGVHRQTIQSRMDLKSIKSEEELEVALEALDSEGGYCP